MRPTVTTSNVQTRMPVPPEAQAVASESEVLVSDGTQAAQTGAGRRKRMKMHDVHVARFLDIEAEVSQDETGSSGGASDSDNSSGTPLLHISS